MGTQIGINVLAGCIGVLCFQIVQCQPIAADPRDDIISNLTALVHFVVSPNSVPNDAMIQFALDTGLRPKSTIEGLVLFKMLKNITKNTPELLRNFTKPVANADGITIDVVDEMALTLDTLRKTKEYERLNPNGFNIIGSMNKNLPPTHLKSGSFRMPDTVLKRIHAVKDLIQRYYPNTSKVKGAVTLSDLLKVKENPMLTKELNNILG